MCRYTYADKNSFVFIFVYSDFASDFFISKGKKVFSGLSLLFGPKMVAREFLFPTS